MMELKVSTLETKATFKTAKIQWESTHNILIVESVRAYIPIDEFQEIFNKASDLIREHQTTKLVFDKQKLRVFHQPSMEWYFIEWKEQVYELGLRTVAKILPQDAIFNQSVKIGRSKIEGENPDAKFHQMSIQYFDSLEEALKGLSKDSPQEWSD